MKEFLFLSAFLLASLSSFGQDTLFVNRHHFDAPVQNVFSAKQDIFVKTTTQLLKLKDDSWEVSTETFSKPYVFFKDKFYESDFIPNSELFDLTPIKELVPQKGKFIATAARQGSRFFVASGSALFEYEIRDHYTKSYHNHSIRDIYQEDGLKVVSTYSGIFVNDTLRLPFPAYSNGPLTRINETYYLSWDELSQFFPPDSTALIPSATGLFAGKARKLLEWKGELYALNTKSVSEVGDGFELQPIHHGLEYLDLEAGEDRLLIGTAQGICLSWDGQSLDTLAQVSSPINDLYLEGKSAYLATDDGVYFISGKNEEDATRLTTTENTVMVQLDDFDNLWISTENGLFVKKSDNPELISVIPNVEFNREAMLLTDQILYVGAVDGLYTLNTYEITKSFIPTALSQLSIPQNPSDPMMLGFGIGLAVLLVGGAIGWAVRRRLIQDDGQDSKGKKDWDLRDLESKILSEKILTVEALASFLETNPVQLNRNFKKLGTTPGKFLKNSKLKLANQLLKSGKSLEEVAHQIGYSSKFLRQELDI